MRRGLLATLLVVTVGAGVVLRSRELFEPWNGLHKAWGGATYGNIARNLLRYDVSASAFAPLTNTGPPVAQSEFEYYYHYPPLMVSMVAASYRVFGVHEGSARLVSLVFSLLTVALVFGFAHRFWGVRAGLSALVIIAFLPVELYYADHVDVYGPPAAFFSALAVFGYALWFRERRGAYMALCLAGIILGCLTAWYTYFVAVLLIVHARFIAPKESRPPLYVPAAVATCAVAVFGLFLLHRNLVVHGGGAEVAGSLIDKLLIRSAWTNLAIPTKEGLIPVGPLGFALHLGRDLVRMFGPIALVLAAGWLTVTAWRGVRLKLEDRDWFVLILLGFGLLHGLAFPMLLPGHDFLARCFSPGIAVAAAIALVALSDAVTQRTSASIGRGMLVGALAAASLVGVALARTRRAADDSVDHLSRWGTHVQLSTSPETVVLTPQGEDRILQYYMDRRVRWNVATRDSLNSALRARGPRVFILSERDAERYRDVAATLDSVATRDTWNGLRLYRFDGDTALRR